MKVNFDAVKIYVRPGFTDLRKGCGGLISVITNEMKLDALSESVFLFCNKNRKLIKVIFWDKTGFWLAQKRLEKATWPEAKKHPAFTKTSHSFLTLKT